MPFGLCNAQATYQRAIDSALKDAVHSEPYIDDTLTYSHSFDDHLRHLQEVFECYRSAGFQLRREKCKFGFRQTEFLGYLISRSGHQPLPSLVAKIKEQSRPCNPKELRSFLGLVNYYRDFIPRMAEIASPLYNLTKKAVKWSWDYHCEQAFATLCEALSENPVTLAYPDWSTPFHLEVDASRDAVGAVLAQSDVQGRMRPISFYSSTLNRAQQAYSTGEKEAWAIVAATRRWRKHLQAAKEVVVWSDHNPLEWMRKQRDPRGKFVRWILELEPINYLIWYRRGSDNLAADRLSRSAPVYDLSANDENEFFERHVYSTLASPDTEVAYSELSKLTDIIRREQTLDHVIADASDQLRAGGSVKSGQLRKHAGLCLKDGLLYKRKRIIVPAPVRSSIMELVHDSFHGGVNRTYEQLCQRFYWKGMYADVLRTCESCNICLENKRSRAHKQPLTPIKTPYQFPRAVVAYDIATLPWSRGNLRYVLIMVDLFSKYSEAVAMPDQETSTVLSALESGWFYRHGYPIALLSDQGRNVDGLLIRDACKDLGIQKLHSSPYHPQGDGEAERCIQSVKQTMRCLLAQKRLDRTSWPQILQEVAFTHNAQSNSSTGYSPNEVMFGAHLKTRIDIAIPSPRDLRLPRFRRLLRRASASSHD